jgi:glycosyltransferase involved in cell wall biosynthesis
MKRIIFVHEGKAAYPDVAAYKEHFAPRYHVEERTPAEIADGSARDAVLWYMMGFHTRRPPALATIHDYRSLSVGRGRRLKDRLKMRLNFTPSLRIYQNAEIKQAMGFRDTVPELFLPMGVPNNIASYRRADGTAEPADDYCYMGSMLAERQIELMVDSFLKRFGAARRLTLFGSAPPELVARYRAHANIVFPGMVPQAELFARLQNFRCAVCYFPNHYPHVLQTPTKLLEYAALGMRVIANEQPQNRLSSQQYGIACHWGSAADMFQNAPDGFAWPDNAQLHPTPLLWRSVIGTSGVENVVDRFFG